MTTSECNTLAFPNRAYVDFDLLIMMLLQNSMYDGQNFFGALGHDTTDVFIAATCAANDTWIVDRKELRKAALRHFI